MRRSERAGRRRRRTAAAAAIVLLAVGLGAAIAYGYSRPPTPPPFDIASTRNCLARVADVQQIPAEQGGSWLFPSLHVRFSRPPKGYETLYFAPSTSTA